MRSVRTKVAVFCAVVRFSLTPRAYGETPAPTNAPPGPDAGAVGQAATDDAQAPTNAPAPAAPQTGEAAGVPAQAGAERAPEPAAAADEKAPRKQKKDKQKKDKDKDKKDKDKDTEAIPGDPWGDAPGGVQAGAVTFRVLLQTRYTSTFASPSTNPRPTYAIREDNLVQQGDGWSLNRFFLRVGAEPTPTVGFRAIIDFAQLVNGGVRGTVKQAYGTLRPLPKHLEFVAGLFKLPLSILELDPIAKYEFSDLGAADGLVKDLGFGGRDVGAEVMVAPLAKPKLLRIWLGAFRGHSKDENDSPLGAVGARVESKPMKGLRLGVDVVGQPYSVTYKRPFDTSNRDVNYTDPDPLYPRHQDWASGRAWSADLTFERWHLMLRGEGMMGNRVDIGTRYGARTFWAAWALAAYRFRTGPVQLMPAARAEWLDADREHSVGLRRSLSFGLNVIFTKEARLLFDVTRTDVQSGSPLLNQPVPIPAFPYFELPRTTWVGQLQIQS